MFGNIEGAPVGSVFTDRKELLAAGVHRQNQAGISGRQELGAESIVISGGYEDDIDHGDLIIYTGHGGRDEATGKRVADQELLRGNLALAKNVSLGIPVRVVRKVDGGYHYDGLFRAEQYWPEIGKSGFRVYRYRLVAENVALPEEEDSAAGPAPTKPSLVNRIVRDTEMARTVKAIHEYRCQACGTQLMGPAGPYAEAAHIRPLGKPHNGPDSIDNILCLCPNHHVMFDLWGFTIAADHSFIGATGMLIAKPKHKVSAGHIAYHRERYLMIRSEKH